MITEVRGVKATVVEDKRENLKIEALSLFQIKQVSEIVVDTTNIYHVKVTTASETPANLKIEALSLFQVSNVYSSGVYSASDEKEALLYLLQYNIGDDDSSLISLMFEIVSWDVSNVNSGDTTVILEATPAAPFIGDMVFYYNRINSLYLHDMMFSEELDIAQLKCSDYIKSCIEPGQTLTQGLNKLRLIENVIFSNNATVNVLLI